jgi:NAD(P)-dependent dehydrogenase (short-subunit alcohol dehydrogenase family)
MKSINNLISLKGRRALVTGATGHIGSQIAMTIAELGGDLILVDKPLSSYDNLLDKLNTNFDVDILCIDCELEKANSRSELILKVANQKGPLNLLFNNAAFVGTSDLDGWIGDFNDQSVETWSRAIEVNLTAAFDLSKSLAIKLKESGNASIINLGSIYGELGPNMSLYEGTKMGNPAAYAASKGGIIQLTRWMATVLAPDIRANVISPGGIFRDQPINFVKRFESKVPLGRMATEEDLKGAIAYLSTDLSEYVTGQNIIIDGGWSVW